jgi:hypothetical protein
MDGMRAKIKISRNEGLRGIHRGYGAALASVGPFCALNSSLMKNAKKTVMALAST